MESLYELTAEKENRGMVHNFLDSMMSMRSRGSTRRRLISSNHNYGSGSVMDSGLDVHYQQGKASEKPGVATKSKLWVSFFYIFNKVNFFFNKVKFSFSFL